MNEPAISDAPPDPSPAVDAETRPAHSDVLGYELPTPTYWPAGLAIGLTSAAFGMITNGIFFYAGLFLVALSIFGWMRLLLAEGSTRHEEPTGMEQLRAVDEAQPATQHGNECSY